MDNNFEYLRYEPNTPLSEILKKNVYMAYEVDEMDAFISENVVIVDPFRINEHTRIAFIVKDGVILKLIEII